MSFFLITLYIFIEVKIVAKLSQITTAVAETTVAAGMPVWRRYFRRLTKAGPDKGGAYTNTSQTRVKRHAHVIAPIKRLWTRQPRQFGIGSPVRDSSRISSQLGEFISSSPVRVHLPSTQSDILSEV